MKNTTRTLISAAVAASVLSGSMGAARAADPVQVPAGFTITGAGWGHGLGMSQYGAYGMALDGYNASQIISHYYTGATAVSVATNPSFRVGIETAQSNIYLRGEDNPVDPSAGGAFSILVDATTFNFAAGVEVSFAFTDSTFVMTASDTQSATGSTALVSWDNATSLINLNSGSSAPSALGAINSCISGSCPHRYKYGSMELKARNAVNVLRQNDQYLYGLGEMPSSWPLEALKAQVIAARSFAISKSTVRGSCDCHIGTTDSDQVFLGFVKEFSYYGSAWVQAVNETKADDLNGLAIYSGSTLVPGYYSSSTGGKTQPRSEVWGTSPLSYLTSVDDHWSQDPRVGNPYASWVDTIDQATLVKNLNTFGVPIADVWSMTLIANYPSGGVSKLNLSDSAGNITSLTIAPGQPLTPDEFRTALGIRSTYVSKIEPGIATVAGSSSATAKKLAGVTKVNWPKKVIAPVEYQFKGKVSPAQLGATVVLQRKQGSSWVTLSSATTNTSGAWSIVWAGPPTGKHNVRIKASNLKGSVKTTTKTVMVAGTITAVAPKSVTRSGVITVTGSVSPGFEGVAVIVERRVGSGSWKKIGTASTDAAGNWSLQSPAGSKKTMISFRAKTTDVRVGNITSVTKRTKVK